MSWEELRTRMAQEASKRLDLSIYRLGLVPMMPSLKRKAEQARFFFASSSNDAAERAALLRRYLPEETAAIIREAENIRRHEFCLLGYENVAYGPIIDWQCDPVHGKRSPLKPWYKINFLDFNEVGDHKIIWELNRHQHLVTLAKAWLLTGNHDYPAELAKQWYDWRDANPYPLGINWASTLEVAFRSLSWLWMRELLGTCPVLPASFQTDLLQELQKHGRYIEHYLSTYFSPNTHLLGEAVALFFIGILCPEISAAQRWRDNGWRIVLEEAVRQVHPDGVYFEQSLYYHVYALDFFLHAQLLATVNQIPVPDTLDTVIKKMLDAVQALSAAGTPEGFGDDDGGRVFNPRRNRTEHMSDPMALGAVAYEGANFPAAKLTEEAIWIFGKKAVDACVMGRSQTVLPDAKAFSKGGIYVLYDATPHAQQMMIDAGPQGTGRSGHGHADALSIRLSVQGRRVLVDCGTYTYVASVHERNRFRGTAAHNTVMIDGLDQAVPEGPFAWREIPNVKLETWVIGKTFEYFEGIHDGYRRLADPVLHRRSVLHITGGQWFVRDVLEGNDLHLVESSWHFAHGVRLKHENGIVIARSTGTPLAETTDMIALLLDQNSPWEIRTLQGCVSPAYGKKEETPLMRVSARIKLPAECGILLQAMDATSEIGSLAATEDHSNEKVKGYGYRLRDRAAFFFFSTGESPWTSESWSSDARVLYCNLERSQPAHIIMIDGSFAEWSGKRLVSQTAKVESYEWKNDQDDNASGKNFGEPLAIRGS
jgi:hypothetical protein